MTLYKHKMASSTIILGIVLVLVTWPQPRVCTTAPSNSSANTTAKPEMTSKLFMTITQQPFTGGAPYVAAASLRNCTLYTNHDAVLDVKALLDSGTSLIKYHLNIDNFDKVMEGKNHSMMYRPLYWVRSTGRHGTGLLLLNPNYDKLSLKTLELGVNSLNVDVNQHPPNCLHALNDKEIEDIFRELVMNDFQNTSSNVVIDIQPNHHVCNLHLTNNSGTAEFRYWCCQKNEFKEVHCKYLEEDMWLTILFSTITLIKIIIVLFSPKLVPDVYYRVKHVAAMYIHTIPAEQKVKLNIVTTDNPAKSPYQNAKIKVRLSKLHIMENFKRYIARMKCNKPRRVVLSELNMRVKHHRLLPEDYAPVGLLTTMYDSFFNCGIKDRAAVKDCCNTDFCIKSCSKSCSWYRVLRGIMTFLTIIILATPWILRAFAYYKWEHGEMHLRKYAAGRKNLNFYFPGNMTVLLTPLHVLFIFIYVFLSIETFVFGVLGKRVKERLKMVLRKCFRDMREMKKMEVVGWGVKILFTPCTRFGGLGLCIGAIFWVAALPFVSIVVAFYLLPTLNITARLLAHFFLHLVPKGFCTRFACFRPIYRFIESLEIKLEMGSIAEKESLEKRMLDTYSKRIQQLVVISFCLISLYSIIFLLTEFVSFIVEVFVYTLMGIILNASTVLSYVSLLLLLGVYGNECFGHVADRFLAFNQKMNSVILGLGGDRVKKLVYSNDQNFAFMVKTEYCDVVKTPIELRKSNEGYLQWNVKRLCLFLSKNDVPLIPSTFYFKSCHMPFYAAPGELLHSYLRAGMEFGAILLFLVFVLIVVMAFGDTYEISATNKLLATVAGGFLPLMLRKVIFKTHAVPAIDHSNINFQACLNDLLNDYEEDWPVYDIDVKDEEHVLADTENNVGQNGGHVAEPQTEHDETYVDDMDQNSSNGNKKNLSAIGPIDLLIDVSGNIDADDFPEMVHGPIESGDPMSVGSTSFLEDYGDDRELQNIV